MGDMHGGIGAGQDVGGDEAAEHGSLHTGDQVHPGGFPHGFQVAMFRM